MIIEYRVKKIDDNSIFPHTPQWRRKLKGGWELFQVFFRWHTFPCYSVGGELICHKRYGEFREAVNFLHAVESPTAYLEEMERTRSGNRCQFEKEY